MHGFTYPHLLWLQEPVQHCYGLFPCGATAMHAGSCLLSCGCCLVHGALLSPRPTATPTPSLPSLDLAKWRCSAWWPTNQNWQGKPLPCLSPPAVSVRMGEAPGKMHMGNCKYRNWVEKSRIPMGPIMATMLSYKGSFSLRHHIVPLTFLPAWLFHASALKVPVAIPSSPPSIISALPWQPSSHN